MFLKALALAIRNNKLKMQYPIMPATRKPGLRVRYPKMAPRDESKKPIRNASFPIIKFPATDLPELASSPERFSNFFGIGANEIKPMLGRINEMVGEMLRRGNKEAVFNLPLKGEKVIVVGARSEKGEITLKQISLKHFVTGKENRPLQSPKDFDDPYKGLKRILAQGFFGNRRRNTTLDGRYWAKTTISSGGDRYMLEFLAPANANIAFRDAHNMERASANQISRLVIELSPLLAPKAEEARKKKYLDELGSYGVPIAFRKGKGPYANVR